jgi:hypothetical protein
MMIEKVLEQRMRYIRTSTPKTVIESYISQAIEGDWGLIVTIDGDSNVKQYWFFESGCSFLRQEAVDQYNTYVDAGFIVTVACPENRISTLMNRILSGGRTGIKVVSFRNLGIDISSTPPMPFRQAESWTDVDLKS